MEKSKSKITEKEIKEIVNSYLENKGYFVQTEFNVGIRPDVVGFKWNDKNEYEIESVAIECKRTKDPRQLLAPNILNNLRELQKFFPNVYLASPMVKDIEGLRAILKFWRIGYYPIDSHVIENEIIKAETSPVLNGKDYLLQVRQRIALILTYIDVFGSKELEVRVRELGIVWCFRKEPANYCAGNGFLDSDYHFGINVEEKPNVEMALNIDQNDFFKILKDLPENYLISLQYIDTRRPREVSWPIFHGKISIITKNELEKLINICKEKKHNVRFYIHKRIWFKDEVLSRMEHQNRIRDAKKELEPLKELFTKSLKY